MGLRFQQTLAKSVSMSGFGLFNGLDVDLELCPAPVDHGIVFERTDLIPSVRIPALIEYVAPQARCTVISHQGARVAVIEHVMAALAGMQIDNCLVRLNAPEPPICDGSAWEFVELIERAGIAQQDAFRQVIRVNQLTSVMDSDHVGIVALPPRHDECEVGYLLNYGPGPVGSQSFKCEVTPRYFRSDVAAARTFILEEEVSTLQSNGIGLRATSQNILVFAPTGPLENSVRFENECARHKLLDCIGDFALIGCDLHGRFVAQRSGHRLNHALIRELRKSCPESLPSSHTSRRRHAG